jgi:hypothetical protein
MFSESVQEWKPSQNKVQREEKDANISDHYSFLERNQVILK